MTEPLPTDLLDLCAEYKRLVAITDAWNREEVDDDTGEAARARGWLVLEEIMASDPASLAELSAMAGTVDLAVRTIAVPYQIGSDIFCRLPMALAAAVQSMAPDPLAPDAPDAALIAACRRIVEIEAACRARDSDETPGDDPEWCRLVEQVTATEAETEAGNRAKLAAAWAFLAPSLDCGSPVDVMIQDAIEALALPLGGLVQVEGAR